MGITLDVDHVIMYILYFLTSMILANVFLERTRLELKGAILHMAAIGAGTVVYMLLPIHWKFLHLCTFFCMVLINLCFSGSYKCKLWVFCITQCVNFIVFTFGIVMFDYIGHKFNLEYLRLQSIAGLWTISLCLGAVEIFKGTFLYYKEKELYEKLSWGQSLIYMIVSIAVILTANTSIEIYREGMYFRGGEIRIALISYTALVGIIVCYLKSRKRATLECEAEETELLSSFSTKQLEAYKRLERLEEEGKLIEEEMGERVAEMMGLMDSQQLSYVKPYVEAIQNQLIRKDNYILTGNTIVDAIINEKYKLACEKHVFISVKISLPEKLSVDVGDLCLIIGNGIDYALEACEKITLGKGNKIKLQGIWHKGYIFFRIWYSKAKDAEPEEKLSGEETMRIAIANDIYGLGAVEKCLEKHDGKMAFYTEGKWHKLEFYFNTVR